MFLVILTIGLVVALAINHVVHGPGCWGLQSGGPTSAVIYALQFLASLFGLGWLLLGLVCRRMLVVPFRLVCIGVLSAASVVMYAATGWTAFTSIHHQGPENLTAFLPVALTTLAIGIYDFPIRRPSPRMADDPKRTQVVRNETGSPYQPPLT